MEIERKFLIKEDTWSDEVSGSSVRIQQGYLAFANGNNPEVRVRVKTKVTEDGEKSSATLTIKSSGDLARMEVEPSIDVDAAIQMLALCQGITISKTRHLVPRGNHTFEVDVYHDLLDGLVVAEVELSSEDEKIDPPEWLGEEVTYHKEYKNGALARHGHPDSAPSKKRPSPKSKP